MLRVYRDREGDTSARRNLGLGLRKPSSARENLGVGTKNRVFRCKTPNFRACGELPAQLNPARRILRRALGRVVAQGWRGRDEWERRAFREALVFLVGFLKASPPWFPCTARSGPRGARTV